MTAGDQMRPFYEMWRARYPNTFRYPLTVREDRTEGYHIESGADDGVPWTSVLAGYGPIQSGQATHEIMGHMLRRILGDAVWQPFWDARFAGCVSVPTLADHLLDPLVVKGTWAYLPIEIFAEAARIAFDPDSPIDANTTSRADRSMDWGCHIDGPKMRAFFNHLLTPAAVQPAPPVPAPPLPTAKTMVVDYFSPHDRAFMDCLKASGVSGIARYLTNSPTDPRQITPQEVADAHAAGLAVHLVFEMNPTYPGYFTFPRGAEDCRQAVARLRELGAPQGTVVYFAVDTDINPALVDVYMNGVDSMRTPQISPGVYGYQRMCEHARANYPEFGKHLWETYGTPTGPLDLWQHTQEARCGVSVDLNDATVAGWLPQEGDDMFTDEDRRKLNRVYDHLEAYEPMTWVSRLQQWLAKAFRSLPVLANADLSGPDVKTGDPFR